MEVTEELTKLWWCCLMGEPSADWTASHSLVWTDRRILTRSNECIAGYQYFSLSCIQSTQAWLFGGHGLLSHFTMVSIVAEFYRRWILSPEFTAEETFLSKNLDQRGPFSFFFFTYWSKSCCVISFVSTRTLSVQSKCGEVIRHFRNLPGVKQNFFPSKLNEMLSLLLQSVPCRAGIHHGMPESRHLTAAILQVLYHRGQHWKRHMIAWQHVQYSVDRTRCV